MLLRLLIKSRSKLAHLKRELVSKSSLKVVSNRLIKLTILIENFKLRNGLFGLPAYSESLTESKLRLNLKNTEEDVPNLG